MTIVTDRSPTGLDEGVGQQIVEVAGLRVAMARNDIPLVEDIAFSVSPGEVLGLVGESGCGKSTAALAMLGYARRGLRITSGSVRLRDVDVLSMSKNELRRIRGRHAAYVPQDPASALNPCSRIGRQLREALSVHPDVGESFPDLDARVKEVIADVQLPSTDEFLQRFPHQLSGGQQQRVAIAMAFACRPDLVILDEPTTGLDVTTQHHILEMLKGLTESYKAGAVYVSHDLAVVKEVSHRVAVMYAGRIVETGSSQEVMRSPRHPYSHGLLRAVPNPDVTTCLAGIEGFPPRPGHWPQGCAFASRCPYVTPECLIEVPALEPVGPVKLRCIHPLTPQTYAQEKGVCAPTVEGAAKTLLSVKDLDCWYGEARVLKRISFDVPVGECTGVVGESGSGKTTLARCLIGLHGTWTGDLLFDDHVLARVAAQRKGLDRRRIQYVFQSPYTALNPRWTIGQIIEEPLRHFEDLKSLKRQDEVRRVLNDVQLDEDFTTRYPDQLSGGERQRVAIARALITGPELLICDEVTSALDVSVQAMVVELLRRLQNERGLSMIFITHNLALVECIAQRVVVLHDGELVEQGPVLEVTSNPKHEYTARLLTDAPSI